METSNEKNNTGFVKTKKVALLILNYMGAFSGAYVFITEKELSILNIFLMALGLLCTFLIINEIAQDNFKRQRRIDAFLKREEDKINNGI